MSTVVSVERKQGSISVVIAVSSGFSFRAYFDEPGEACEVHDAIATLLAENERLRDEAARVRKLVEALAKEVTP